MMKSKLPRNILSKLEEQKDEQDEWTVGNFSKRLKRYVTAIEAGDQQLRLYHSRNKTYLGQMLIALIYQISLLRYTGKDLMLNELS